MALEELLKCLKLGYVWTVVLLGCAQLFKKWEMGYVHKAAHERHKLTMVSTETCMHYVFDILALQVRMAYRQTFPALLTMAGTPSWL